MHNLAQDMVESDEAFRSHFDRNSADFHKGDPTAVPVGGARVPESMQGAPVNWMDMPVTEDSTPVDIGPKATRLMEVRTLIGDLKKSLEVVCKPIDAILRIKSDPLEENKDALIAAELIKHQQYVTDILSFVDKFHDDEARQSFIKDIALEAAKEYADRDSYGTFMLDMKRHQSQLFLQQKSLLQDIKKAKQEYIASLKQ